MPAFENVSFSKAIPVLGVQVVTSTAQEFSDHGKIPALWNDFYAQGLHTLAEDQGLTTYGLYSNYTSDETGDYTVTAGVGPIADGNEKDGLKKATLQPGTYLKFSFKGPLPETVIQGWQAVWAFFKESGAPKRSFKTDYEVYGPDGVDIFIGVEEA